MEEEGEGAEGVFEEEEEEATTTGEDEGAEEEAVEEPQSVDELQDDINITDSQVMIQLKEAEEEAECLRREIKKLKMMIEDYQCRAVLTDEDKENLQDMQVLLMEKIALLDEVTKRIARLMELAGKDIKSEDTTILDEEEEEGFPDDLLPKVVICSSWDDMMPKVVVCMDMKKPGAAKKKEEDDRDENGLTPEQREALEQERRCMAEERNRLQYQIACMEGEMRVMLRENDMLSRKVAQLKAEMENQPPFEFEMSVSATNPPGCGGPKPGNMDVGFATMGPDARGAYTMGGAIAPGGEAQGKMCISGPPPQLPPGFGPPGGVYPQSLPPPGQGQGMGKGSLPSNTQGLPCGGVTGIPGKSVPCPMLQPQEPPQTAANDWSLMLPPYGKKCRKDFNAAQQPTSTGGGGGCCGTCCGTCCGGNGGMGAPPMIPEGYNEQLLPPELMKPAAMDVNFKVNVQPQAGPCGGGSKKVSMDTDARSNRIAQQLQEIETELRRMQRDLCKAKRDKETLKAQQDTLNCAKNYLT